MSEELTLEDQTDIILAMGPVWRALGRALVKLAKKGILADSKFNLAAGTWHVKFFRERGASQKGRRRT